MAADGSCGSSAVPPMATCRAPQIPPNQSPSPSPSPSPDSPVDSDVVCPRHRRQCCRLSFLRFSSCNSKPCAALVQPRAEVCVAPITLTAGKFRADARHAFAHARDHRVCFGVAVLAGIIGAFKPNHGLHPRQCEYVTLQSRQRRRAADK